MTVMLRRATCSLTLAIAFAFSTASTVQAEPNHSVQSHAEQYKEEALKLLEQLVNIDSARVMHLV
ncbi:glutamate carboxypeptidase [Pseudomonas lutea]|uniref:Glutamate carboxypeptidase n=1 Tax=Pseudomonas lutea TaxID=243924 RepID=A0A9X8MGL5_9PSED|nr:glutamate carboxypeptidase [Pseudomonas lutea]